jgi:hypothetical protein
MNSSTARRSRGKPLPSTRAARGVAPVAHEGARPEAERSAAPGSALDERSLNAPRDDLASDALKVADARARELRVHAHGAEVAQDRLTTSVPFASALSKPLTSSLRAI